MFTHIVKTSCKHITHKHSNCELKCRMPPFSNSELTEGALQLLTMSKCQFLCSVLQLLIEYMILWPAKVTARVTQNMEQMSPCWKRIIGTLASMAWWLGGTLATYWIYAYLTSYYEQNYTQTQGRGFTDTVEETTQTHNIIKRALQEGFVTQNPCMDNNWINNPICNDKLTITTVGITTPKTETVRITSPKTETVGITSTNPKPEENTSPNQTTVENNSHYPKPDENIQSSNKTHETTLQKILDADYIQIVSICITTLMFACITLGIIRILYKINTPKQQELTKLCQEYFVPEEIIDLPDIVQHTIKNAPISTPTIPCYNTPIINTAINAINKFDDIEFPSIILNIYSNIW